MEVIFSIMKWFYNLLYCKLKDRPDTSHHLEVMAIVAAIKRVANKSFMIWGTEESAQ